MQETVMLAEWQQGNDWSRYSTEVVIILHSVVQRTASKFMEKIGALVQPIWTICLDEIVRFVTGVMREEKMNENVKTYLNKFSKQVVALLVDLS